MADHKAVEGVADHLESHQEEDLGTSPVHGAAVPQNKECADNLHEGHHNPADNLREEDRFGTGRVLAPESDIHHEACHWSFLGAEGHSGIRNWGSAVAYVENRAAEKRSCKKPRGFHRRLPVLQDHGFESRSRLIRKSCHDHQALRESDQYLFRRMSCDCVLLEQKKSRGYCSDCERQVAPQPIFGLY